MPSRSSRAVFMASLSSLFLAMLGALNRRVAIPYLIFVPSIWDVSKYRCKDHNGNLELRRKNFLHNVS